MYRHVAALARTFTTFAALVTSLCAQAAPSPTALKVPNLEYQKFRLSNGLEIIVHEDHRLPLVALDIWYHVGPRNEKAGRTGFAHLFEHMMFEGSEHVGEKAHIRYLEAAGATDINGTTDFDRTNYFETLPSDQVELGLWLESDRMGFLLETLDRTRLTNQRDVVRNERRQGEGFPYELAEEEMVHQLFPKGHPYYADVIGSHADIESSRLLDVRDFFRQYYAPNNATLAIAGDVDTAKLKPLLDKYFGPIPAASVAKVVDPVTPSITTERRAVVTDTVQLSQVRVAWLTPPAFQPGNAEADLFIQILGTGKSSRLYRKLVYEQQIAQKIECENQSLALASVADCRVTARPGVTPEVLERAINREIETLRTEGPTQDELDRARNMILSEKIEGLERRGGFGGVADMMDLYNQYVGDPGYLPKDIARFQNATVSSVRAIGQQHFAQKQRCTIFTVPGAKVLQDVPRSPADTDAAVKVTAPYPAQFERDQAWRKTPPPAAITASLRLPQPKIFTLRNGMKVYLVEEHSLPVVRAEVLNRAGAEVNPPDRPGLAGFTVRMLTEGTETRSAVQIADESDRIGGTFRLNADEDGAFASIEALSSNAGPALALLNDVVRHPVFPASEVERIRQERLAAIVEEHDDPFESVFRVAQKVLYGEGPYAYPPTGTTEGVKAVTQDNIAQFWRSHYGPQTAALVLTGDVSESDARTLAEKYFGDWSNPALAASPKPPQTPDVPHRRVILVDKPGAPQTALFAFGVGLPRTSPDYVAATVMNSALGQLFSSRINMNLRERNGFTYGARSRFLFHRGAGPFYAGALVRTDVTAPAARELFFELNRIRTDPPNADEVRLAKDYNLHSLPGRFERYQNSSALIGDLFIYGLPADYYRTLPAAFDSVTRAAVQKAALDTVHPDELLVIAVGDRSKIEAPLSGLKLGAIELHDESGALVQPQPASGSAVSGSDQPEHGSPAVH